MAMVSSAYGSIKDFRIIRVVNEYFMLLINIVKSTGPTKEP